MHHAIEVARDEASGDEERDGSKSCSTSDQVARNSERSMSLGMCGATATWQTGRLYVGGHGQAVPC